MVDIRSSKQMYGLKGLLFYHCRALLRFTGGHVVPKMRYGWKVSFPCRKIGMSDLAFSGILFFMPYRAPRVRERWAGIKGNRRRGHGMRLQASFRRSNGAWRITVDIESSIGRRDRREWTFDSASQREGPDDMRQGPVK